MNDSELQIEAKELVDELKKFNAMYNASGAHRMMYRAAEMIEKLIHLSHSQKVINSPRSYK